MSLPKCVVIGVAWMPLACGAPAKGLAPSTTAAPQATTAAPQPAGASGARTVGEIPRDSLSQLACDAAALVYWQSTPAGGGDVFETSLAMSTAAPRKLAHLDGSVLALARVGAETFALTAGADLSQMTRSRSIEQGRVLRVAHEGATEISRGFTVSAQTEALVADAHRLVWLGADSAQKLTVHTLARDGGAQTDVPIEGVASKLFLLGDFALAYGGMGMSSTVDLRARTARFTMFSPYMAVGVEGAHVFAIESIEKATRFRLVETTAAGGPLTIAPVAPGAFDSPLAVTSRYVCVAEDGVGDSWPAGVWCAPRAGGAFRRVATAADRPYSVMHLLACGDRIAWTESPPHGGELVRLLDASGELPGDPPPP